MPVDRLFHSLLRSLQTYSDKQDTPSLLSTATSVLCTRSNPLNLTLLTSHLLSAPAIWAQPDGLRTCVRIMGAFQSTAATILRHEEDVANGTKSTQPLPGQLEIGGAMSREDWVKAVIHGADDRSPRWRHPLVIAGLLIGFEGGERKGLSKKLKSSVESGLVTAINTALQDVMNGEDELGAQTLALVLNYTFEPLQQRQRERLNYDRLLPVLISSAFFSTEGFQSGYFFASIHSDLQKAQEDPSKLSWSDRSPSYDALLKLSNRPLMTTMGTLARLISTATEHCSDRWLIQAVLTDLLSFSRTLALQWRQCLLSSMSLSDEPERLDGDTLTRTLPLLWKLLRSTLFTLVIVLRGVTTCILNDRYFAHKGVQHAATTLTILKNIYFITSRLGAENFTQHTFVYLTSIDIVASSPASAVQFLESIRPSSISEIPSHAQDLTDILYYLNTSEHFSLALSPPQSSLLLLPVAQPYLALDAPIPATLAPLFEAAHSVVLSVLSAPQSSTVPLPQFKNQTLAAAQLGPYTNTILDSFPSKLSARQFRLAIRSLVRIMTPPAPLANQHPAWAETLLELLRERSLAVGAGSPDAGSGAEPPGETDERTTLVLTVIDVLPYLPAGLLEIWLPEAALLIPAPNSAPGVEEVRRMLQERFWHVLSSGEMDTERARACVAWWSTRGGRELVMHGPGSDSRYLMSGALPTADAQHSDGVPRGESKL